ncbi:MAG: hypothetical protein ACTJGR_08230, partial [Pauljensenia sp.]
RSRVHRGPGRTRGPDAADCLLAIAYCLAPAAWRPSHALRARLAGRDGSVLGGWWLVAGGWWLVAGGWWALRDRPIDGAHPVARPPSPHDVAPPS